MVLKLNDNEDDVNDDDGNEREVKAATAPSANNFMI